MQSLMILNVIQWNNVAVATLIFLSIVLPAHSGSASCQALSGELRRGGHLDQRRCETSPRSGRQVPPRHSARTASICRRHAEAREAADNARSRYCREAERYCPLSCPFFRKEVADHWRLGCQVKVKMTLTSRWRNLRLMSRNGNAR